MVPKAIRLWTNSVPGTARQLQASMGTAREPTGNGEVPPVDKGRGSPVQSTGAKPARSKKGERPAPAQDVNRLAPPRLEAVEPNPRTAEPPREANDEQLAARIAMRNVTAFGMIYDRYAHPVYAMAAHMLGVSEAEEVTQEVFMRLWHKAGQFDPVRGPFSHWFMSIARNHILDKLRARSERQRLVAAEEIDQLLAEAPDPNVDVLEQVWSQQRGDVLLRALHRLPPEQRRVIVLAYFGELSQSAIATYLGVPLGTVKKRIRLGLHKLRAALSPHELDLEHMVQVSLNGAQE